MAEAIQAELLTLAVKLNNYDLDATAGGLWTSTTVYQATVPAGKRWWVLGGVLNRDVSSTALVQARDSAAAVIFQFASEGAAATLTVWPNRTASAGFGDCPRPFPLDPGEMIRITLGTAQSTAAFATCVVLEVDV